MTISGHSPSAHTHCFASDANTLVLRYYDSAEIIEAFRQELATFDGDYDKAADEYFRFRENLKGELVKPDEEGLSELEKEVKKWGSERDGDSLLSDAKK